MPTAAADLTSVLLLVATSQCRRKLNVEFECGGGAKSWAASGAATDLDVIRGLQTAASPTATFRSRLTATRRRFAV